MELLSFPFWRGIREEWLNGGLSDSGMAHVLSVTLFPFNILTSLGKTVTNLLETYLQLIEHTYRTAFPTPLYCSKFFMLGSDGCSTLDISEML